MRTTTDIVAIGPEYATAVAVRLDAHDRIAVCGPHGLDDLLDGVRRINRAGPTQSSPGSDSPAPGPPNAGPAS